MRRPLSRTSSYDFGDSFNGASSRAPSSAFPDALSGTIKISRLSEKEPPCCWKRRPAGSNSGAFRIDEKIVEYQNHDASVELPGIRRHVRLDRGATKRRRVRSPNREVDQREGGDGLRLPVFEDLEIVFHQTADEFTVAIGDDRVDLDVIDGDAERGSLRGLCRRLRARQDATDGHCHE